MTICVAVRYYRTLLRAQKEYEKAKHSLDDVVLSFSRQLQREADKLEATAYKVEVASSKANGASQQAINVEKAVQAIEAKLGVALLGVEKESSSTEEIGRKVQELIASQSALVTKVSSLDDQFKQSLAIPEPNVQAAIPIRRDKALAPLTETELSVLEMLASEGPKTPPEIKERVKLSREHTSRLMKKLYEGGYLERDAGKIPFRYSLKKEMETFLKGTDNKTSLS